jgi:hypothetical protein
MLFSSFSISYTALSSLLVMSSQDQLDLAKAARGGLCATCTQAKLVRSSRGSLFLMCTHPNLPKYQGQPVLQCRYFTRADAT